jgi:hypothetical protein
MSTNTYIPLMILAALAVYAGFLILKRQTGSSSLNEIEEAHAAEARSAAIQHEAHVAQSDEDLADRLLPSHSEAMIIPLGAPMESEYATFKGSLAEARQWVAAMTLAERAHIAIWTPGHIFTASELLAEASGHEHDPLPPAAAV